MNNDFLRIAKQNGNIEKITQIMIEGDRLRNELLSISNRIIDDLKEYNKSFKETWVYKEPKEIWGTAVFQDCFLKNKKYNVTIDVDVTVDGFSFSIFERDDKFDKEFKNILKEIFSDLEQKYTVSDRAYYNDEILLDEYDKIIDILKNIFEAINKYIESKKYGT